jgi:type II secretory pathway component PulF
MNLYLTHRGVSLTIGVRLPQSIAAFWIWVHLKKNFVQDLSFIVMLMHTGIGCAEAIAIMAQESIQGWRQEMWQQIHTRLWAGLSIGQALGQFQPLIDPALEKLVSAGHDAGVLREMMRDYQNYQQWSTQVSQQVWQALAYPLIILGIIGMCSIGIIATLVPQLMVMAGNFGAELPGLTRVIIWMWQNLYMTHYLMIVVIMAGVVQGARRLIYWRWPHKRGALRYHWPLLGLLNQHLDTAHWLRVVGILYRAQVSLPEALQTATVSCKSVYLQARFAQIAPRVITGKRLSQAFADAGIIPAAVQVLMRLAEASGDLENVWQHADSIMEASLQKARTRLLAVLHPAALGGVAMILLGLVQVLIVPMYEALSQVG